MELAAPTEADIVRIFGVTPRDLNMRKVTVNSERGKNLCVYPMRLEEFPMESLGSTRRLRFGYKVGVLHGEEFLAGALQLTPEQGATWMDYLSKEHTGRWDKEIKPTAQHPLPNFSQLMAQAEDLQSERQQLAGVYEDAQDHDSEDNRSRSDDAAAPIRDGGSGPMISAVAG